MAVIRFGTDGWRGVIAEDFTFKNVRLVAQAIADYIISQLPTPNSQPRVVVGYDTRFLSEEFAKVSAEVLIANQIFVYFLKKPYPTPLVAFAIKTYDASGAIMLTASHNPPQYNGIKFIPSYAGPATTEITTQIEENIRKAVRSQGPSVKEAKYSPHPSLHSEMMEVIDPLPPYIDHLKTLVNFEILQRKRLKVILDPLYGAGQNVMGLLFKEAGCQRESIHGKRDPLFGSKLPDPSFENLRPLASRVLKKGAELGLALDGDGDRFGVIDAEGEYFSPNQVLALLAVHLLKTRKLKGAVVRSVATTHLLDKIASKYGVEAIETPVGFKFVGKVMREKPVVLGGEESGGLSILGHIPEKDGLLAGLLLTEMVAYEEKSLSLLLEEIYQEYGYHFGSRLDMPCSPRKKSELLESLKSNPPSFVGNSKVEKVELKDGVKYYLSKGNWILFRSSGTEPLIRIYIEATSKEHLLELKSSSLKLFKLEDQFRVKSR